MSDHAYTQVIQAGSVEHEAPSQQREKPYRIARVSEPDANAVPSPSSGAYPRYAPRQRQEPGVATIPDHPTQVFSQASGDDDMDSPTEVIVLGPKASIVRQTTGESIALELPAVVGKGSAAKTRIAGNNAISRAHARIECAGGEFAVEDLGSTNGTTVNGKKLRPGEKAVLDDGDKIELANEMFVFRVEQQPK